MDFSGGTTALSHIRSALAHTPDISGSASDDADFQAHLDMHFAELCELFHSLYGGRADWLDQLTALIQQCAQSWRERPAGLKAMDAERAGNTGWFQSNTMLGGVCYVDRYAEDLAGVRARIPYFKELGLTYLHLMPLFLAPEPFSDGGYAVSSYRQVNPMLGTMEDLTVLAADLRANGISLVVDFIFNHTSNEHEWATKAAAGDPEFSDYYWMHPDRTMPDAFEKDVREIFPDDHPGSFVQQADGRWVWTTFHTYQWDLNYSNPDVFRAMAGEMLFLANQGVDILRMDAVAFIWKQLGTPSENLPQAHTLLRAFNKVCRLAAPSMLFKSEAIVHPDEVAKYIDPAECQISYNPLQMALIWDSLATRNVTLLSAALEQRHTIPDGTAWVNYVRSHDDIGWTFADEDAAEHGINGFEHRRFLNSFYVNRFPGSFARGVPFQDNPKTGDCRISGTTASLAGLEQDPVHAVSRILLAHSVIFSTGGIPLLYLGDEVGQLNDYQYALEDGHDADSRWVHRPHYPAAQYARREEPGTLESTIYAGLRRMIEVRAHTAEFAGTRLIDFHTGNPGVLAYQRPGDGTVVLMLANFTDFPQVLPAATFSGFMPAAVDLLSDEPWRLDGGLALAAHQYVWLRVRPQDGEQPRNDE
ncbi:alpha-amylase family glycosyl hydrolase [Pseudarthrobacter sp. PS3-L1]|uniref:alpha-amylase family glycosyl hydrolase n=1 Tax=Pseudarthrobacter sp. PS3-L1 TaxID=3046207 RepID=UPI0024BA92B2|nr:alpha-amylase family glycosyl hydrolase [Pseudarthrobacter sp. PS3-L1]MDJ0319094.1 alpha-amylase family glycosyl hydrolase [Pseudarthrobacter sp. PS3-L1]